MLRFFLKKNVKMMTRQMHDRKLPYVIYSESTHKKDNTQFEDSNKLIDNFGTSVYFNLEHKTHNKTGTTKTNKNEKKD